MVLHLWIIKVGPIVQIYLADEIPLDLGWRDNAQFKLWPQFAGGATHLRESNYGYGREGIEVRPFNNDFFNC